MNLNCIPKRGRPSKDTSKTSKNCFYLNCKSFTRNANLNEALKKDHDHNYCLKNSTIKFFPFYKPCLKYRQGDPTHAELVCDTCLKSIKWLRCCGRLDSLDIVTKNRYVCSLHFVDNNGPTERNPFPVPYDEEIQMDLMSGKSSSCERKRTLVELNNSEIQSNLDVLPKKKRFFSPSLCLQSTPDSPIEAVRSMKHGSLTPTEEMFPFVASTPTIEVNESQIPNARESSSVTTSNASYTSRKPFSTDPALFTEEEFLGTSTPKGNDCGTNFTETSTSLSLGSTKTTLRASCSFSINRSRLLSSNITKRKSLRKTNRKKGYKVFGTQTNEIKTKNVKIDCTPIMASKLTQTKSGLVEENKALKLKIEDLNNKLANCVCGKKGKVAKITEFENKIRTDSKRCLFYTGLYFSQILAILEFLGPAASNLNYWNGHKQYENKPKKFGRSSRFSIVQQIIITLLRLRCGFLEQDIAYRFDLSKSTVNSFVTTWVVFLNKEFQQLKPRMFPPRSVIQAHLPTCFRNHKNVRVIIDCTEFFTESPSNFSQQGNMYSNYKNNTTYKVLYGCSPTGAITFISKAFEGAISDREIFIKSGLKDLLDPLDCVMADRGFTIADYLLEKKATLNIPPFLYGRDNLTPQEELQTKEIAKLRIFVEHSIGRVKRWRILKRKIPLTMQGIFNEIIFVIGCLVNFQTPIVKY